MRIYVAGPMQNVLNKNYPAFIEACTFLRNEGLDVVSPHELNPLDQEEMTHAEYMRADLKLMLSCDAIVMLKGWPTSRGARDELHAACSAGLRVYTAVYDYDTGQFDGMVGQGVYS